MSKYSFKSKNGCLTEDEVSKCIKQQTHLKWLLSMKFIMVLPAEKYRLEPQKLFREWNHNTEKPHFL